MAETVLTEELIKAFETVFNTLVDLGEPREAEIDDALQQAFPEKSGKVKSLREKALTKGKGRRLFTQAQRTSESGEPFVVWKLSPSGPRDWSSFLALLLGEDKKEKGPRWSGYKEVKGTFVLDTPFLGGSHVEAGKYGLPYLLGDGNRLFLRKEFFETCTAIAAPLATSVSATAQRAYHEFAVKFRNTILEPKGAAWCTLPGAKRFNPRTGKYEGTGLDTQEYLPIGTRIPFTFLYPATQMNVVEAKAVTEAGIELVGFSQRHGGKGWGMGRVEWTEEEGR